MKLCVAFHFVVHELAKPLTATFLLYMRFWLFQLNLSNGKLARLVAPLAKAASLKTQHNHTTDEFSLAL
jgi:hypothetical protein